MNQAEYKAAQTLLEKGIEALVTAPLLFRLFGKKHVRIRIRPPYLGTILRISELYLSTGITDEQLEAIEEQNIHLLYQAHLPALSRIAAYAVLNGKWTGRLFGPMLAGWLTWKLTPMQLLTITKVMVTVNGSKAFTNTISLVSTMKVTSPTLSQTTNRS